MTCPAYDDFIAEHPCHWCDEGLELANSVHVHSRCEPNCTEKYRHPTPLSFPDWSQREHERCQKLEKALRKYHNVRGGWGEYSADEALAELKET